MARQNAARARGAHPVVTRRVPASKSPIRKAQTRGVLSSRFASGELSSELPWLVTQGRQLLTVSGDALMLRGLMLSDARQAQGPFAIPDDWPLNVVRLTAPNTLDEADQDALDNLVAEHAEAGAYTILAMPIAVFDATASRSEQLDITNLVALATRYAEEPAVLFEPILPALPATDDANETARGRDARRLRSVLAPLRAVHPRALCLVPLAADEQPLISDGQPIPNLLYTLPARRNLAAPRALPMAHRSLLPRFVTDWRLGLAPGLGDETLLRQFANFGMGWAANAGEQSWLRVDRAGVTPTAAGRWLLRALTLAAAWDTNLLTNRQARR